MSIRIKSREDLKAIEDAPTRVFLERVYDKIMAPMYKDEQEFILARGLKIRNKEGIEIPETSSDYGSTLLWMAQEGVGYMVYIDNEEDLFRSSDEFYLTWTGIYHADSLANLEAVGWESVDYNEELELFNVFWLANNEFGICYVFPKKILKNPRLMGILEAHKSTTDCWRSN